MFHDIIFIFIIIIYFLFFLPKKGNGLKLDENRLDGYRSWTKVYWTKTALDENRLDENRLDENELDEMWVYPSHTLDHKILMGTSHLMSEFLFGLPFFNRSPESVGELPVGRTFPTGMSVMRTIIHN